MYFYLLSLFFWPISFVVSFFLKIRRLFNSENSVRILNYHSISSDLKGKKARYISVTPEVFSSQMKFLADHDYKIIALDDFLEWRKNNQPIPSKCIILTFDDGYEDNYSTALPILLNYNFKALFSIITNYTDRESPFPWINHTISEKKTNKPVGVPLSRWQIKSLSDHGMKIAAHTQNHIALRLLEEKKAVEEMLGSKRELENILNAEIQYFTFPFGSWGNFTEGDKRSLMSAGYKAALSTKVGCNHFNSDLYELRRIPIYNIDGVSNFKRKVTGAYDFLGLFQQGYFLLSQSWRRR